MIKYKNKEQIRTIAEGGKLLAKIMDQVVKKVKPGMTTGELNDYAEKLIDAAGAEASFKNYKAAWAEHVYPAALCISVNDEVVHGIPSPHRKFKEGDIVGLDCGLKYQGLFTDMARTVAVGNISSQAKKLMSVTQEALMAGIKKIKPGRKLSDISKTIQAVAEKNNFSVVRQLCGHGVGFAAHEDPQIPNYWPSYDTRDLTLEAGMVLAIEPMVNAGGWEIDTLDDGWTIVTSDGSLSAHFEHTVAVTEDGYEILTK
ncbi:MAG: type I methionyl aminopeptidase [Candidatus Buchananbacteria bacterium]|jgi:methionyl aminopeptidase